MRREVGPPADLPGRTLGPGIPSRPQRELLSIVCHDLKVPLASITMGVGFLRKVLPGDNGPAMRVVEAMQRSAVRMDRIISSFSDLAKLEAHELALDVRPCALEDALQNAFERLCPDAAANGVGLSLSIGPGASSLWVTCDRDRLSQILEQLLAYALTILPAGGAMALRASADDGSSVVCLALEATRGPDGGCGPFKRELSRPELAIAKGLIDLHGGQLDFAWSESSFSLSFALPRAQMEPSRGPSDHEFVGLADPAARVPDRRAR